ncbi:hypothetical protein ACSXAS_15635 (plasmid) [Clostridium perfringens]|uniref:hypothetical protein n=1 Tax=Clostridium perfringens TaxID=1502 RepID=UPI00070795AA|nr:hypothetical protein [Clostridium perfringens]KQC91066.1 hypothetical protein AM596_16490 [Clostridium perfringens CP4]MDM0789927.1 hypothetical protein [Clostridium perfringens]
MPSVRQGGGYTLTFSRKNEDVKDILDKKKNKGIIITDYLCQAVRFYEENKEKNLNNSNIDITDLVRKEMEKILNAKEVSESVEKIVDLEENLEFIEDVDDD